MLNSGPIKVKVLMNQINFNLISGIANVHIFWGPSVKQVILQMQNTLGLPMIPYYSSIDWDFFNKETNNIYINNIINLDDIFYNNISLFNSFNTEKANFSKIRKNNDNKKYILFLDSEIDSKELDDSNYIDLLFLHKDNQKLIKYFYLLNNINTIGLQESKFYNDIISSQLSSKSRVMLFSSHAFINSNTLSYKIIKDVLFTFEGIRTTINKLNRNHYSETLFVLLNSKKKVMKKINLMKI